MLGKHMFKIVLINLIVTVVAYLTVPIIFCLCGKKMTRKQIRKISIINGCCVCFGFIVFRAIMDIKGSSGAVAIWMPIGYWIMSKNLLISNNDSDISHVDVDQSQTNTVSTNNAVHSHVYIPKIYNCDSPPQKIHTVAFCRKCGNKLILNSVFCNKCGFKIDKF